MKPVYINDIFGEIVARVSAKLLAQLQAVDPAITGVHYQYGHYTDIQERLITFGKGTSRNQRFPLICVFEDEKIEHRREGFFGMAKKKILILAQTTATRTRVQREEEVFKPILYPIYEELLTQIFKSGKFNVYSEDQIEHSQINRPHWGDPGIYRNEKYLFTDVLDGIELSNLNLQTYLKTCEAAVTGS